MNKKILVVAAHPDDEIIGCGGTIARLIKEGYTAYSLILGKGIISRGGIKDKENKIRTLNKEMKKANEIIGVKKIFTFDFPDNKYDNVPLLDIIKKIEEVKNEVKPEIIFTHFKNDLNVDHKITYEAVITATRPMKNETVKTIYSFELLSSTEWSYPTTFSPDVFFDITKTINKKIDALSAYKSEIRKYPHPRSLEAIKLNSKLWGCKIGIKNVEAFQMVRSIL